MLLSALSLKHFGFSSYGKWMPTFDTLIRAERTEYIYSISTNVHTTETHTGDLKLNIFYLGNNNMYTSLMLL